MMHPITTPQLISLKAHPRRTALQEYILPLVVVMLQAAM